MEKKTAIITGASRGIGRAIANAFAENGYNVIINYKSNEEKALSLSGSLKVKGLCAEAFRADVGSYSEAKALVDFAYERFGSVDVLVNNAGISQIKLFTDITEDDWSNMISTNLTGVFNCSQHAAKYMISQKSGNIINISSMWGSVGASCEVHYSAAKAGVIGLTKGLAKELGLSGIRVNCITPGVIMTEMMDGFTKEELDSIKEEIPLDRFGTPEDVAEVALFLASDSAKNITGQVIGTNGGMVI